MAKPNAVQAAVQALRHEIDNRKTEIAALVAQREAVATATPARQDMFDAIDARLEADAARYRRELHNAFGVLAMQPLLLDTRLGPDHGTYDIDLLALASGHGRAPGPEAASAAGLALLAGAMIRESLHREVGDFLAGKTEGLPLTERRAELARLDAEIAAKREELNNLVAEAAAAGVTLAA